MRVPEEMKQSHILDGTNYAQIGRAISNETNHRFFGSLSSNNDIEKYLEESKDGGGLAKSKEFSFKNDYKD